MHSVGIDCRFASELTGLGTYTRSLVTELVSHDAPWSYVLFVRSLDEPWLKPLRSLPHVSLLLAPFKHYSFAEQSTFPRLIRTSGCDLFFVPHFNVPLFCPVPFLCTVHDLILHTYPNQAGFFKRMAYRMVLRRALLRSKRVIAVSEATKKEIGHQYGLPAMLKTTVIHPGIDPSFIPADAAAVQAVRDRYSLPASFLLYVGNCKEHKNVPVLLNAFEQAALGSTELLLCTSKKEAACLPGVARTNVLSGIPVADLPALYSAASGFVTATLCEGFGFPLLEAMACGCPVLGTLRGSLPEIAGSHALLVEPTVDALASGMRRLLTDSLIRSEQRRAAAGAYAHSFRWQRTAADLSVLIASSLPPR